MCVFVNTLRPEVTLRVWDIFLNEGSKALFRIAAALFQMNEAKLLAAKDASDLFGLVRNIGKDVIDADALIALAYRRHSVRPLLSKLHRLPSQFSKTNNNNNSNNSNNNSSNARSKSVDERKRHINVNMISEIVNPRLRNTNSNQGAVPADLIGIGLAHIGPDTCPNTPIPRTEAYSENQAYLEAVGTIGEPSGNLRSSIESKTDSSPTARFAAGNTLLSRDSASERIRFSSLERKTSTDTDRNSLSGSSERPRSVRQFTPLQVSAEQLSYDAYILQHPHKAPGVRRPGKHKVLNFHRVDIALWRTSYRPSLEEQYRVMDEARQQWKREASTGRYSEMIRRKSDAAAGLATAAATAALSQQDKILKVSPEEGAGISATAAIDTDED